MAFQEDRPRAPQNERAEIRRQDPESPERRHERVEDRIKRLVGKIGEMFVQFSLRKQSAESVMKSANPDATFTLQEQEQLTAVESAAQVEAANATEALQALEIAEPPNQVPQHAGEAGIVRTQEELTPNDMGLEQDMSALSAEQLADQYRRQQFDARLQGQRPELLSRLPTKSIETSAGAIGMGAPGTERQAAGPREIEEVGRTGQSNDHEQKQERQLSFSEARAAIMKYAGNVAESGDQQDLADAAVVESMALGMNAEGQAGIEAIDRALQYLYGVLQTKSNLEDHMTPAMAAEWQEQMGVKDALLAERKSRTDNLSPTRNGAPALEATADHSIRREAAGNVILAQETTQPVETIPEDRRGLFRYFKDTFGGMENASLDEFRRAFSGEAESKFQGWTQKHLESLIKDKPAGARYPDTVASVFGNNAGMLQRVIALKEHRVVDQKDLLAMPFSQIAMEYLNVPLPQNYFDHFSSPHGAEGKRAA